MRSVCRPFLLMLLLASGIVESQTVYESRGREGKVYSDRPIPGGKAVELRPLNVIEPIPVSPRPSLSPSDVRDLREVEPVADYRSLSIVFPEMDGSVAANHATFEVRVAVDPPLRIDLGHAFSLRMDGRVVPGRYTATEMMIPPEFFDSVAPAGVQRHVLEVGIVDAEGRSLKVSAPVSFQTRFVTVLQRPRMHPLPIHPSAPEARPRRALPAVDDPRRPPR